MIKLFISDLDNTLFDHEKQIHPEDQNALHRLMDAGLEIGLASGRMDFELVQVMNRIQARFHRISQNGAFIYTKEGKCLQRVTFPGNISKQIYEAARPFGLVCFVSEENEMFVAEKTEKARAIEERMKMPVHSRPQLHEEIGKSLFPSKVCFFGELNDLKRLDQHIHQRFPSQVDSFISDTDCLDFIPTGISKGNALEKLADELGLKPEEIATVGDSFNDVSMLEWTPHSFAMRHAPEEVKQKAGRVVSSVREACEWVLQYNQSS